MLYCDPADLYAFGLPRGSVPNPGRLAGSVSVSSNTIELDEHGFALNDTVTFRAEAEGTLPGPLQEGVDYYAVPVNASRFSVAASVNGTVIDLTTAGSNIIVITPLPIASAIFWASELLNDMIPAAILPLTAIPPIVRMTCAELASGKLASGKGAMSKTLSDMVAESQKRIARWAKGIPIRGTNAPQPANLAQAAYVPQYDNRGWNRYGGIG